MVLLSPLISNRLLACNTPEYRTGLILVNTTSEITMQISMRQDDFAPDRLICLAETIKSKFPDQDISVTMFTDHEAARNYPPVQEKTAWMQRFYSKLHAMYVRSHEMKEDYLLIVPDGRHLEKDSPLNTRIDLPTTNRPVCRLTIGGRCLLAFQHMDYPSFTDTTDVAGKITVIGIIQKNGTISDVTVVNASAEPSSLLRSLSDWVIQHLRSWRFDPGTQADKFQLTFSFVLTDSGPTLVEMHLPNEVRLEQRRSGH